MRRDPVYLPVTHESLFHLKTATPMITAYPIKDNKVGTSPDILTKNVIREKPKAANRIQIIPFDLLDMSEILFIS